MQGLITNTVLKSLCASIKTISRILPVLLFSLFTCPLKADDPSPLPIVVISQIVQHVSLDLEREGILAALKDAGYIDGQTVKIVYENAQGNMATSNLIASNFASLKPAVAVAISTPSAQSLMKPMAEQNVPIVFTAVTDPLEAKLVTRLDARPEAVTGVSDALKASSQLDLVKKLVPSVKNIGVVYNPGETNSVKAVQQLREEAMKRGFTLVIATADKSSDIVSATTKLVGKVDAIYIPNDNTAVAAMESIVILGKKFQLPIFAGDAGSVERGALAAQAYDRDTLGRAAGAKVAKILKGEKAGDLIVETDHPLVLMLNLKAAKDMGVTIPEDLKAQAKIIGEKP
ncbi:MAG: ABC transporter substrate-binding protein [Alphaproteobacteria bacterium]|jgi:putative ABC transport system substrate-binding protein|nr:ABC transporter substrate-binding protein [Alphaproteobacteria bacterium]